MQVNAQLISEEAFVYHLPAVLKLCADNSIPATLFELTFILACLHYEKEKCQVVVLEVGLGGELDATNVVTTALSVLCSVCKCLFFSVIDVIISHNFFIIIDYFLMFLVVN